MRELQIGGFHRFVYLNIAQRILTQCYRTSNRLNIASESTSDEEIDHENPNKNIRFTFLKFNRQLILFTLDTTTNLQRTIETITWTENNCVDIANFVSMYLKIETWHYIEHDAVITRLTHCGREDLWKWAIFNSILTSPKSWLSQEDLDAGCEHSLVPMDS